MMTNDRPLQGKTIVLTGGSSGIGAAAASSLATAGAKLFITGRSEETARVAGELGCAHMLVDYGRFDSVRALARRLLAELPRIDVLINNVGAIFGERRLTDDGHERTLQVNHLSGFLLTLLLRERLAASQGLVVDTASAAHRFARLDLDDLESARRYKAFRVYANSKLMNILHVAEVARRFHGVRAAAFHPGAVATGFAREGGGMMRWFYNSPLAPLFMSSPAGGIRTLMWIVTSLPGQADFSSGGYYERPRHRLIPKQATADAAERLWTLSEALVGEAATARPVAG